MQLVKKPPATASALDDKMAKWIVKKVVRAGMIKVSKHMGASDWNAILTDLWSPIRFDNNGFSKP